MMAHTVCLHMIAHTVCFHMIGHTVCFHMMAHSVCFHMCGKHALFCFYALDKCNLPTLCSAPDLIDACVCVDVDSTRIVLGTEDGLYLADLAKDRMFTFTVYFFVYLFFCVLLVLCRMFICFVLHC